MCLLDYEWLYGRDKSAPTSTVCSLLYIYAMNKPCGVFVGLWNDVRARWICPYVCGVFADIMQWINLAVCLLDYEMMYGRDKSVPTPTECSLLYIYAMNKPCGVFVELWMMYWRDKSAPTPTECSLIYILRNEWALWSVRWIMNDCRARWICPYAYGVFVDIHFTQWMSLVECPLIYILSNK